MSIKKKILSIVLAVMLILSSTIVCSCGKKNNNNDIKQEEVVIPGHETEVEESDHQLFYDGKTDYTIVYPEKTDENIMLAVNDIKNFVYEATGIEIKAQSDNQNKQTDKIISLGNTKQMQSVPKFKEDMDKASLGKDGYIIITQNDSVYLLGNTSKAVMYAALDFLHYQLDFEYYAPKVYSLKKNVKNLKLKDFNIIEIPDIEHRSPQGTTRYLRTSSYTEPFNSAENNTFVHNYFRLIPKDKYEKDHPLWFSNTQLCLNAHGNKEERALLVDTVVEEMEKRYLMQPDIDWMAFSHNDGGLWCNCDACKQESQLYDGKARSAAFATVIRFVNEVAQKIKAWNKEVCPERSLKIFIYDYGFVTDAPVKVDENKKPILDENGNYQPYSEELMLDDIVGIYMCGFDGANYLDIESNYNKRFLRALKRDIAIMKNPTFFIWTYSTCFGNYLVPYNTLPTRQSYYKYFKDAGAKGIFDQAQFTTVRSSDFGTLKSYVSSKLMWNTNLDVNKLIKDFFVNYYGKASVVMERMYADYRSFMLWQINEKNNVGQHEQQNSMYMKTDIYPLNRVRKFQSYVDEALELIEDLKNTNQVEYERLYNDILRERLTWDYLELRLYPDVFSVDELNIRQKQFIANCDKVQITQAGENWDIHSIF